MSLDEIGAGGGKGLERGVELGEECPSAGGTGFVRGGDGLREAMKAVEAVGVREIYRAYRLDTNLEKKVGQVERTTEKLRVEESKMQDLERNLEEVVEKVEEVRRQLTLDVVQVMDEDQEGAGEEGRRGEDKNKVRGLKVKVLRRKKVPKVLLQRNGKGSGIGGEVGDSVGQGGGRRESGV